jgi:arsenite/tail-anchored protein-transporting ATPase
MPVGRHVRILLFTGKGGVGKTTLAAATAARLAAGGRKALVVSTDPAHSLADALGIPLGGQPSEVGQGLFAAHVDSRSLVDTCWQDLRGQLSAVLAGAGLDELDAEELTVLPGVDELLALTEVARLAAEGPWEVLVVDGGATAETLRLIALPEAVANYLDRLYPPAGRMRSAVAGVLGAAGRSLTMAAGAAGRLADHLAALRRVLTDPEITSVHLVLTPERIVVAETRRTLTALALRGIRVDRLVANRMVPRPGRWRGPAASWLRTRRAEQDAVLAELTAGIPLDVHVVEHRAAEPVGVAALLDLATELYAGTDPLGAVPAPAPQLLRVRDLPGSAYQLTIALPLAGSSDLELARVGDDLAVTVDGVRRLFALPVLLRRCTVTDAEAGADGLVVRFEPPAGAGGGPP